MTEERQTLSVRFPPGLYERMRAVAFERRVSINSLVVAAVEKDLGEEER